MTDTLLHLSTTDWAVVGVYILLLLYLGMRGSRLGRSSAEQFVLGGRLLTLPAFVAGLVSTWYGGILGIGEFTYRNGIANWVVFGAPYYVFALVFAVFFAQRIRRSEVFSIPEMLERTYDRRTGVLGAVFVFFLSSPAPYFLMLAVLIQVVSGWPMFPCLLAGTAVSVAYVYIGGFRAVVRTDLLQFTLMFAGFFILLAFLVPGHGVFPFLAERLPASHLTPTGGRTWQYVLVWFFIALWTLVAPQFHQFTLSARDERTARRGIVLSVCCWVVFDAMTTLSGLYARALFPDLHSAVAAFPVLGDHALPPLAKGMFYVGMLATVMSTTDGMSFISAVTVGRDLFGAAGRDPNDVRRTQYGVVITAVVAVAAVAAFPSVIELWYVIGTLFIPGLLIPLVAAYYPRLRIPGSRTTLSMIAGFGVASVWFAAGFARGTGDAPAYPLAIEPMYAGLLASALPYVLRRGFRPPPAIPRHGEPRGTRA